MVVVRARYFVSIMQFWLLLLLLLIGICFGVWAGLAEGWARGASILVAQALGYFIGLCFLRYKCMCKDEEPTLVKRLRAYWDFFTALEGQWMLGALQPGAPFSFPGVLGSKLKHETFSFEEEISRFMTVYWIDKV